MGRILGPFSKLPISTLRISPIGLSLKSDGGWRLITHLSYPPGNSVNSYIDPELSTVTYTSLDNILEKISELKAPVKLSKMDVKSAFRLLIISPADFDLLGIQFEGEFYINKCLPFGCSIACNLFEKFATFLQWVVEIRTGLSSLDHYLDDFIFMGGADTNNCMTLMSTFKEVCSELGVPVAENKTMGPTTVLPFLGFIIDTELMMILIPPDKLAKLKSQLIPMLSRKKVTLKELESVTGLMSFCSKAIPSSRAFIRRFYDLMTCARQPYHKIRLNQEVKSDINLWLEFLDNFNGQVFFPENLWTSNETLQLFTDSSGNPELGCGAYFQGSWAQFRWPESWRGLPLLGNMALLEFIPVVLAMFIWADSFKNKKIIFHIDNMALVSIVNKRSSKDKSVMKIMRPFVLLTMLNNLQFKATYIEGTKNKIADALSRFQMLRFRTLAPTASSTQTEIPQKFLSLISSI